jgi:soluble lytic murein transglycosylase-like protein
MTQLVKPCWSRKSVRPGEGPLSLGLRQLRSNRTLAGVVTAIAATGCILTFSSQPAKAQVIEVQQDGSTAAYAGPVQTVDGVSRAIAPPAVSPRTRIATPAGLPQLIQDASDQSQLSSRLIAAVAWQESRMNQAAVSPKGARGVMQLRPGTAARLGVDADDLSGNIHGGAAYLAQLLREFDGDIVLSLAAYNAGPEAVRRWGGVPPYPETRAYVAAVLDRLSQMSPKP